MKHNTVLQVCRASQRKMICSRKKKISAKRLYQTLLYMIDLIHEEEKQRLGRGGNRTQLSNHPQSRNTSWSVHSSPPGHGRHSSGTPSTPMLTLKPRFLDRRHGNLQRSRKHYTRLLSRDLHGLAFFSTTLKTARHGTKVGCFCCVLMDKTVFNAQVTFEPCRVRRHRAMLCGSYCVSVL